MKTNETPNLHFCPGLGPQVSSFIQKQVSLKIARHNLNRNTAFVYTLVLVYIFKSEEHSSPIHYINKDSHINLCYI